MLYDCEVVVCKGGLSNSLVDEGIEVLVSV